MPIIATPIGNIQLSIREECLSELKFTQQQPEGDLTDPLLLEAKKQFLTDAQAVFPDFANLFKVYFKGRIDGIGRAEQQFLIRLDSVVRQFKGYPILLRDNRPRRA